MPDLKTCFFIVICASLIAAKPSPPVPAGMSLSDAVNFALTHSPRIAKADALLEASGLEIENAKARLFPSLDLSANHGLEKSLPEPAIKPAESPVVSQLSLALTQPLYDNGESGTRREIANLNRDLATIAKGKARDDLILDVARGFYRLSLTDILVTIKRRQQELLSKQYRLMNAQYQQGLKTKKDFLRFKSETQRASITVQQAQMRREEAEIALTKLLGHEDGTASPTYATLAPETVAKSTPVFPKVLPDIKTSYAYKQHAIEAKVSAQNLDLARRKNSPEITLGAGANYGNAGYLNSDDPIYAKDSVSWNIMLGFKYNIWDGGSRRREAEIVATQIRIADLDSAAQLSDLDSTLQALMANLVSLKASHYLNKELMELEEESYQHLEGEYRQGRVSYLDLITALADLLDARVGFYTTYISILESLAEYSYYEGTLYDSLTTR